VLAVEMVGLSPAQKTVFEAVAAALKIVSRRNTGHMTPDAKPDRKRTQKTPSKNTHRTPRPKSASKRLF